jgi:antirestriction protein ArdC
MHTAYQVITDRIIAQLEKGTVPWRKPWQSGLSSCNFDTKHEYTGINRLMTNSQGFTSPYFLTFNQVKKHGGMVKKGEHSVPIIYFNIDTVEKDGVEDKRIIVRYSNVFNIQQTNIEAPPVERQHEFTPIEVAENIIRGYENPPLIFYDQTKTCYQPNRDIVCMLDKSGYLSPEHMYYSLFHELSHSTGHAKRLNREGIVNAELHEKNIMGYEELIAEISASFLLNAAGIDHLEQNAAYCASWLKIFKGDPKLIIKAASEAEKSANYILGERVEAISPIAESSATVQ